MNLKVGNWVSVKDELPLNNRSVLIAVAYYFSQKEGYRYSVLTARRFYDEQTQTLTKKWETVEDDVWGTYKIIGDDGMVTHWCDTPPLNFI